MKISAKAAACILAGILPSSVSVRAEARKIPPTTLSVQYGRVLKEGVQKVTLTAVYENKGLYATQIALSVEDAKTGNPLLRFSPEQDSGYSPAITLADFTGDGILEIFFGADSGGSGGFGFYYVFSVMSGSAQALFDFRSYPENFSAAYANGYKVQVSGRNPERQYLIDISGRDADYLSALYDENGILRKPVAADVSAVNTVLPFFANYGNRYNLLVMRRITGLYNADSLGYTQEFLQFSNGSFTPYFTSVDIL